MRANGFKLKNGQGPQVGFWYLILTICIVFQGIAESDEHDRTRGSSNETGAAAVRGDLGQCSGAGLPVAQELTEPENEPPKTTPWLGRQDSNLYIPHVVGNA
jgi:hypothetical protein